MASFIRCDGCARELRPAERQQVRVRIDAAADGDPMEKIATIDDCDLCRTCRDRLVHNADPRNWPRPDRPADADRARVVAGIARQHGRAA